MLVLPGLTLAACSSGPSTGGPSADSGDVLLDSAAADADTSDTFDIGIELRPERDSVGLPDGSPDNTAPSVRWLAPRDGDTLVGDVISLSVESLDSRGVAEVTFLVDGLSLDVDSSVPFETEWSIAGLPSGPYELTAESVDEAGNLNHAAITVRVQAPCEEELCEPTQIEWLEPSEGASVCRIIGFEVEVRSDREIEQVQFRIDTDIVGVDTNPPWRVEWDSRSLPDGVITVIAEAFDSNGDMTFEHLELNVANGESECSFAPDVAVAFPPDGAALRGVVEVVADFDEVEANAVTLFVGGLRHAALDEPPFTFLWNSDAVAEGRVELRLLAAGDDGRSGEAAISVTVDRTPPTIAITSPFGGAYIDEIPLTADVFDASGSRGVAWYRADRSSFEQDAGVISVSGDEPVALAAADGVTSLDASELAAGVYDLFAVATDRGGLGAVATASFAIDRPPTIRFVAPLDDALLSGPTTVIAQVEDDRGPVTISLWVDGVDAVESVIEADGPIDGEYALDWAPLFVAGPRLLELRVTDDAGRSESDTRNVSVDHPPSLAVDVCRPGCEPLESGVVLSDSVVFEPSVVDDGEAAIARSELFVDELSIESRSAAPFALTWDTAGTLNGAHTIRLHAETGAGAEVEWVAEIVVAND